MCPEQGYCYQDHTAETWVSANIHKVAIGGLVAFYVKDSDLDTLHGPLLEFLTKQVKSSERVPVLRGSTRWSESAERKRSLAQRLGIDFLTGTEWKRLTESD